MTKISRGGLPAFAVLCIALLPGCTVVEEVFAPKPVTTDVSAKEPLEPSAPPPTSAQQPTPGNAAQSAAFSPVMRGTPPLVVIRFDKSDVAYEKPLYEAMNAALAKQPDAVFYVVGITPPQTTAKELVDAQAKSAENVTKVVKAMTQMGLPESRISVSSTMNSIANESEVRVFVR